jgi:predicted amidohydrolase YtcJ
MSQDDEFVVIGDIRTMATRGMTSARAMKVRGGQIAAVSAREDLTADTVYDFGDRVVLPGFCDPHSHAEVAAATQEMVDLRAPQHGSISDVLDEISLAVAAGKGGEAKFLVAQANLFFDQKLAEGRYPLLTELDSVTRDHAIAIQAGGHVTILNSKAMELAEIGRFKTGESGVSGQAVVEMGDDGLPTGVVSEIDGYLPIPQPSEADFERLISQAFHDLYTRFGVTSLGEISHTPESLAAMSRVAGSSKSLRVDVALWVPYTLGLDDLVDWRSKLSSVKESEFFHVAGVKMFCDGGYSAHNAATLTPYLPEFSVEPNSYGQLAMTREGIAAAVVLADQAELQLVVHTNGERAQVELAEGVVAALEAGHGRRPVRSEHAGNLNTSDMTTDAWRRAGLVPVSQPVFLYNFGDFIPRLLGEPAEHGQFNFRRLLDDGWHMCGSSDYLLGSEVGQSNPLFGVWCAVKRQGFGGDIIEPDQRVSVDEGLRMHTIYAAEAMGIDGSRGSLEAGKAADFVVLDKSPFGLRTEDELLDILVDNVFVDGVLVHERSD